MEIRRIRPEEAVMTEKIMTVVFNGRNDFTKEREKSPERMALQDPTDWRWGTFEGGKMTSCLIEMQYSMRFDGHDVGMTGIGGVGTLPEERKGGKIRKIFEKMLPESYENGTVFSGLTPFSHAFYRKFGYELSCARKEVSIPAAQFEGNRLRGTFKQVFPGGDTADLQAVHAAYIADINQAIRRDFWPDDRAWKGFIDNDPYNTGIFLYTWYDEGGEPKAYIKYKHVKEGDKNGMRIEDIAFADRDSLYGVLSLVGGLGSQYRDVKWMMPTFLDPIDLVDGAWQVEQRIVPRDMARVVNVARALELMRRPDAEGRYVLQVEDPQIPANQGRYLVEYGREGAKVTKGTGRDADLICDIPTLSQLAIGYRTLDDMLRTRSGGYELRGNVETLKKVFTLRPQHVTEYF